MKIRTFTSLIFTAALAGSAHAQLGQLGSAGISVATAKLFADNPTFSADLEIQMDPATPTTTTVPGKMFFDSGKCRTQISLGDSKGPQMGPQTLQHLKMMGMETTTTIIRPDKKISDIIYPSLTAYAEIPLQDPDAGKPDSSFKKETTEIGKETLDGHPCVKNKVVVTDDLGKTHESTVWNATDLKKFPIKIEVIGQGHITQLLFKNVKLSKPDPALFEPPSAYKKYPSQQALVTDTMKTKMGGMALPPGHP